jgi:hypothetical protein
MQIHAHLHYFNGKVLGAKNLGESLVVRRIISQAR